MLKHQTRILCRWISVPKVCPIQHIPCQTIKLGELQNLKKCEDINLETNKIILLPWDMENFSDNSDSLFLVKVSDVLWNLFCYYKQFIPSVEQSLQEMRKPIERDLKVSCFISVLSRSKQMCNPIWDKTELLNFGVLAWCMWAFYCWLVNAR